MELLDWVPWEAIRLAGKLEVELGGTDIVNSNNPQMCLFTE